MFQGNTLVFVWLCFCIVVGMFGDSDAVKSVSVMEGNSDTLHPDVTDTQTDDLIMWKFGINKTLIVKINKATNEISIKDNVLGGKFRGRLKVDGKTGSLTINNITNTDSGLYEMTVSGNIETDVRFNVTVYAATTPDPHSTSHPPSRSPSHPPSGPPSRPPSGSPSRPPLGSSGIDPLIVLISAAVAGPLLLVVSVGIFCICRKQRKTKQQVETHEEEITYADPTFYKRNTQKPSVKQEDDVVYARVVTRR